MFTCGLLLEDGSQCLHESRRKALGCIERGKIIDAMNQAVRGRAEALEKAAADRKAFIETNTLLDEARMKIQKLEEQVNALNIDNAARLTQLKIVTEERDLLTQAAIHEAQKNQDVA